jgi:hypothetical protein
MNKAKFVLPIIFALIFLYFSYSYSAGGPKLKLSIYDGGFYSNKLIENIGTRNEDIDNIRLLCPNQQFGMPYCVTPTTTVKANTEYKLEITNLQPNKNFDLELNCNSVFKKETLNPGNSSSYTILGSFLEPLGDFVYCYIKVQQDNNGDLINFWIAKEKTGASPDTYHIYPESTTTQVNKPVEFKIFSNKTYCPYENHDNSLPSGTLQFSKRQQQGGTSFLNLLRRLMAIMRARNQQTIGPSDFSGGAIFNTQLLSFSNSGTYNVYIEGSQLSNIATVIVTSYTLNVSVNPSTVNGGENVACKASISPSPPGNPIIYWSQDPPNPAGTFSPSTGNSVTWKAPSVSNTTIFSIIASTTINGQTIIGKNTVTVNAGGGPGQPEQKCYMGFGYKCPKGVYPPDPSCQRDPSYDSYCQSQIRE